MPGGKGNIRPEDGKQFSKDYQPDKRGRNTGESWASVFKRVLSGDESVGVFDGIEELEYDKDAKAWVPSGRIIKKGRVKMPTRDMVAMSLIQAALRGDIGAVVALMNRMDGLPKQEIDLTELPPPNVLRPPVGKKVKLPPLPDDPS